MTWYMRGGISATEAFALSPQDREIIANVIKENFEASKKAKVPLI
tara:strand:- start:69 stop:203 length:135 start_codon:yes stop_codon:yes gene_type:complete